MYEYVLNENVVRDFGTAEAGRVGFRCDSNATAEGLRRRCFGDNYGTRVPLRCSSNGSA
jgi:hypothetical protein